MATADWSASRIRVVTALALFAVFFLGMVTGAGLVRLGGAGASPPGAAGGFPPTAPTGLPGPFEQLGLTAEQTQRAQDVLAHHRPELEDAVRDVLPKVRTINVQIEAELRALLTADQAAHLDAIHPPHGVGVPSPEGGGPFGLPLPGMPSGPGGLGAPGPAPHPPPPRGPGGPPRGAPLPGQAPAAPAP